MGDGKVADFDGDLADYRRLLLDRARDTRRANRDADREVDRSTGVSRKDERRAAAAARAQVAPLRRKAEAAEKVVERLHQRKAALAAKIADPALYQGSQDKLVELKKEMAEIERAAAAAEADWLAANMALEAAAD